MQQYFLGVLAGIFISNVLLIPRGIDAQNIEFLRDESYHKVKELSDKITILDSKLNIINIKLTNCKK